MIMGKQRTYGKPAAELKGCPPIRYGVIWATAKSIDPSMRTARDNDLGCRSDLR